MPYKFSEMFSADTEKTDDLEKSFERVVSQAKACVNNPEFKEYRKAFVAAQEKMVAQMIQFTNTFMAQESGDMSFYGTKMVRMVTKLSDLKALLDAVDADIRKEKRDA